MTSPSRLRARRSQLRRLVTLFAFSIVLLVPALAQAYPWMVRHGYGACNTCHTDPGGGGLLNAYGRVQSEQLLRMPYGDEPKGSKLGNFLFNWVPLPKEVNLAGVFRQLVYVMKPAGQDAKLDSVLMQADLHGEVALGAFRANASVGYGDTAGSLANVTHGDSGNLVSREHWLGVVLGEPKSEWMIRAGRINLPYGIRLLEHTLYARVATRVNLKDAQQHGLAIAYTGEKLRAEVMGIAGNFQTSPDEFRERGYSALVEYLVAERVAVGASSLFAHAKTDRYYHVGMSRFDNGVFVRAAPWAPLTILVEEDVIMNTPDGLPKENGHAGFFTADLEATQGLHFMATGEWYHPGGDTTGTSLAGWLSSAWFFLPHADLRVDVVRSKMVQGPMELLATTALAQLHLTL